MPGGYVPCRPSSDPRVHLYPVDDPDLTLCGRAGGPHVRTLGDGRLCSDCARALVKRVFAEAGVEGLASLDVTVKR